MNKIKKGDQVVVITGKDRGIKGQILAVLGEKVLVSGVNAVKKHQKPNPARGQEGGIIDMNKPIHISNVAILNAAGQKDSVCIKLGSNGKNARFFKSNGESVPENIRTKVEV